MNTIQQIHDGPVAQILLDRPDVHNAFNAQMIKELTQSFESFDKDKAIKVVVLSSTGKNFCAGADLNWMKDMVDYSEQDNFEDAMQLATLFEVMHNLSKPLVVVVDGAAFGGALGLIACGDVVLTTKRSRFCFSEVKLGLVPATIAPYVIQKIGVHHARRYLLTAETFDAEIAKQINLVHEVSTQDSIEQASDEIIGELLQNGPTALSTCKTLIKSIAPIDTELKELTSKMIAQVRVSVEGQHGIKAFFNKQQPDWIT